MNTYMGGSTKTHREGVSRELVALRALARLFNGVTCSNPEDLLYHIPYFRHYQFSGTEGCHSSSGDSSADAGRVRQCLCVKINGQRLVQTVVLSLNEYQQSPEQHICWDALEHPVYSPDLSHAISTSLGQ
jgi:hypothetical protein